MSDHPSVVNRLLAMASLLFAVSFSGASLAQVKPRIDAIGGEPVESVLWVGNSFFYYNNSMHNHVDRFIKAADPHSRARATSVTISGSGIDWHDIESYLRPNAVGKYSFVPGNKVVFNPPGRQFDTVIVMDCSQCPIHPQLRGTFHEYVRKDRDIIAKAGARMVLFMSWAYKDKPEMTAQLAEQYTLAGNAAGALVIPAGLAFAKAIGKRPDLEFYQPDDRHPTLIGTYLAAATTYAAVYGKSPVGNPYTAGIERATAEFLQAIAQETVREYLGR